MLGVLRRCSATFQSPQTRRSLYLTILRSHFSYVSQLSAPQKVELLHEMEKVQRWTSKFILNLNYSSEISYKERLLSFQILPVSYWLEQLNLLFLFKVIHDLVALPSGVCPAFHVAAKYSRSTTNNGRQLVVKKRRTTTYQNSYFMSSKTFEHLTK